MAVQDTMDWAEEAAADQQRRLRLALLASALAHGLVVSALSLAPSPKPFVMPPAITVELLAALPAPAEPAPKARPKPVPPAVVPPPPPKPKVKLLPKEAPSVLAQPKPKPKPKPKPEPTTVEQIRKQPKPKELEYDDALAQLRKELGEAAPVAPAPELAKAQPVAPRSSRKGMKVAPELAAWNLAVERHLRANWTNPPGFRESGFMTELRIEVAADGRVVGEPEVTRSSGNPFYDDNAKRAIAKSSPLPPPPKAGRRTIIFTPEE